MKYYLRAMYTASCSLKKALDLASLVVHLCMFYSTMLLLSIKINNVNYDAIESIAIIFSRRLLPRDLIFGETDLVLGSDERNDRRCS